MEKRRNSNPGLCDPPPPSVQPSTNSDVYTAGSANRPRARRRPPRGLLLPGVGGDDGQAGCGLSRGVRPQRGWCRGEEGLVRERACDFLTSERACPTQSLRLRNTRPQVTLSATPGYPGRAAPRPLLLPTLGPLHCPENLFNIWIESVFSVNSLFRSFADAYFPLHLLNFLIFSLF